MLKGHADLVSSAPDDPAWTSPVFHFKNQNKRVWQVRRTFDAERGTSRRKIVNRADDRMAADNDRSGLVDIASDRGAFL